MKLIFSIVLFVVFISSSAFAVDEYSSYDEGECVEDSGNVTAVISTDYDRNYGYLNCDDWYDASYSATYPVGCWEHSSTEYRCASYETVDTSTDGNFTTYYCRFTLTRYITDGDTTCEPEPEPDYCPDFSIRDRDTGLLLYASYHICNSGESNTMEWRRPGVTDEMLEDGVNYATIEPVGAETPIDFGEEEITPSDWAEGQSTPSPDTESGTTDDPGTENTTDPENTSPDSSSADCSSACSPRGWYYSGGTCHCVDSDGTTYSPTDPDDTTPHDPGETYTGGATDEPDDDGEGNDQTDKWLKAIKGDTSSLITKSSNMSSKLSTLISQGNTTNSKLQSIKESTSAIADGITGLGTGIDGVRTDLAGISASVDGIGTALESQGTNIEGIAADVDNMDNTLSNIEDLLEDGAQADIGNPGELPTAEFVGDDLEEVEEVDPLAEQFANYIQNGIPGLSAINNFSASASGNSSIDFDLYGQHIVVDFADWQTLLSTIGALLIACAGFVSFRIITA